MSNNLDIPYNDDDIIRLKSEQDKEKNNDEKITEFRNKLIKRINDNATRYTLRDIANLLIYNNKKTFDKEFFDVNEIFNIIDELLIEYTKNKEGD